MLPSRAVFLFLTGNSGSMRLTCPKLVVAVFAAFLYGALVVFGQALHFLPGLNHLVGSGSSCDCHHHCSIEPVRGQRGDNAGATVSSAEDCPICSFFATSQDRLTYRPVLDLGGCVSPVVLAVALVHESEPFWVYSARGPPAV